LVEAILELQARGGLILTQEKPGSHIFKLELAEDLFEYRNQWNVLGTQEEVDSGKRDHLLARTLSRSDLFERWLLSLP